MTEGATDGTAAVAEPGPDAPTGRLTLVGDPGAGLCVDGSCALPGT